AGQALRRGEVDLALAGGVRLWLSPVTHIGMSKARMLSRTGQARTFDDAADGIVMGGGVGAVVLTRLRDAERGGAPIHGVILASGGKRRAGVSSFGFSGTNAHLVLEEYVPPTRLAAATSPHREQLILLSARNEAQLQQKARDLLKFVEHDATCNRGDDAASAD